MSFIKEVYILNFQIHPRTVLKLNKGLNVFWGESDQGKSSIIRGIRWALCNRPLGDGFRKHETSKTSVGIKKGDEIILRTKSNTQNDYRVNKEKPHAAPKASVPEDVTSSLNLSEVNIQSQQETFFLVHQSPGQRSKTLNEVAGLEIMDKTLKLTNTEIREVNGQIKLKKDLIKNADDEINDLAWIHGADALLSEIEKLDKELEDRKIRISRMKARLYSIRDLEKLKEYLFPDEFIAILNKLIDYRDGSIELEEKVNNLDSILMKFNSLTEKKGKIRIINTSKLKNEHISLVSLQNKIKTMKDLSEEIVNKELDHFSMTEELIHTEYEIKKELKKLGICPLCKKKTTATSIH